MATTSGLLIWRVSPERAATLLAETIYNGLAEFLKTEMAKSAHL
jgi:hypothetical protein